MLNSRNYKLKHIIIIGIIFLFLTSLRLLWLNAHTPPDQPIAQQGILDLRNYQLTDTQSINLNGEWTFTPEMLIDPKSKDEDSHNSQDKIITLPTRKSEVSSYQFGTYQLRILLDENQVQDNRFGIRIPSVKTASSLYINGQLGAKSGEVATNSSQHVGQDIPYTAYFTANKQEIDIILHISNFNTPESVAIGKSIQFGSAQSITHVQDYSEILIIGTVVVLIMHSLYSIFIYIFIYRNKVVLFFTIGFLLPAIDELITHNKALLTWLHLDYDWSLKLYNLIYLGASFFFIQFMRVLLTNFQHSKIFRWLTMLYALCALLIVMLPTHYLYLANALFSALYLLSFFYVVILALKEFIQKQEESFFLVFTALSTTSGILWGVIKAFSNIEIPFYPFDYLFGFLGFACFWFMRFYLKNLQVDKLVEELREADKLKDNFLKDNSQKLWNPLNEMITIAQTIYEDEKNSLALKDKNNINYLIDIGRSMSFVLNDILDFTRLKEHTIHIHPKSMNVQAAVSGVFDMLRFITEGKQIQMISTIPKSFQNVLADENRLIQILFNLLHNAIKYTDAGYIVVHAEIQNGMATIHIQDSGIGMDEETQKRIFSPFEQGFLGDGGIGLGLSVCKQLIELQGGTLEIHSIPNQGSNFFFTLPLAEQQMIDDDEMEVYSDEKYYASPINGSNNLDKDQVNKQQFKILAIDDDPINLKIISSIFSSEEYTVVTITSGKEVLSLLAKTEWDLIILDAMMPYMSGYELTRLIREQYTILELPILLLTARSYPEDVYTGYAYGANDYVTKPINSLELKSRGRALINLKHSVNSHLHMEAAWLQAQIQPHFLFNTLNTIASLSTVDPERMISLLTKFGDYLRGSFDMKNLNRVVPLKDELELINSYLYIEKERFGDRLQVIWDVDENLAVELPPLSIQPLVENAVRHGVLKNVNGGTVCIRITDHQNYTKVTITDDGIGMTEEQLKDVLDENKTIGRGIGLLNTNRRLKRIYGQGLQISSKPNQGTEIVFFLPKD